MTRRLVALLAVLAAGAAVVGCDGGTGRVAAAQRPGTCLAAARPGTPPATTVPAPPAESPAGPDAPPAASPPGPDAPPAESPAAGGGSRPRLPALVLDCLDGTGPVRLTAAGPLVINLWASWCAPCRTELPAVQRFATRPGAPPVIGVDTRDTRTAGTSVVTGMDLTFPVLADPGARLSAALGRNALPATVLVDGAGRIAHVYNGPPLTEAALAGMVRRYLGGGR